MTTPFLITGWEHGVATLTTNGGGLASSISGTPDVQSGTKRTGSYALHIAGAEYIYIALPSGSPTTIVGRIYINVHAWPAADADLVHHSTASGDTLSLKLNATSHKVFCRWWTLANGNTANLALSLDTWYRLDYKFIVAANPHTIDFQVTPDGGSTTTATQSTYARAATTFNRSGVGQTTADASLDMFFDDWVASATSDDYPIGAGVVIGISPASDGTHSNSTDVLQDNDGNHIGDVTAYDHVNSVPMSATTYIKQTGTGTDKYAEVNFSDLSDAGTVNGAMALLAYEASGTTADEGGCIVIDEDATATTVWGNPTTRADYSESSVFYKSAILPTPSGGWDQDAVNALKARMGYSNNVTTVPYWVGLLVEVDYVPSSTPAITVAEATQSQASDAVVLNTIHRVQVDEKQQSQIADPVTLKAITPLTVGEATQAQTSDAVGLTYNGQQSALIVAEASQSQASDPVTLTTYNSITVAEAVQAQSSDAVGVTFNGINTVTITTAEAAQTQTGDAVTLTTITRLTCTEGTQTQTGDAVTLTFTAPSYGLVIGEAFQTQVSDPVMLNTITPLTIGEGRQTQTVDPAIIILSALILHGQRRLYPTGTRATYATGRRGNYEVDDD